MGKCLTAPLKATASERHQRNRVPNTSFIRATAISLHGIGFTDAEHGCQLAVGRSSIRDRMRQFHEDSRNQRTTVAAAVMIITKRMPSLRGDHAPPITGITAAVVGVILNLAIWFA